MQYTNDDQIKKALGIGSWRELSKEGVTRFVAMTPDMDKEVALKIVEQLPAFTDFALEAVNVMQKAQEAALADNRQSQAQVHEAWQEIREILKGHLDEEDLTWEQKRELFELIMETGKQESAKDTENKQFQKEMYMELLKFGGGVVLAVCVVFLNGRIDKLPAGLGKKI